MSFTVLTPIHSLLDGTRTQHLQHFQLYRPNGAGLLSAPRILPPSFLSGHGLRSTSVRLYMSGLVSFSLISSHFLRGGRKVKKKKDSHHPLTSSRVPRARHLGVLAAKKKQKKESLSAAFELCLFSCPCLGLPLCPTIACPWHSYKSPLLPLLCPSPPSLLRSALLTLSAPLLPSSTTTFSPHLAVGSSFAFISGYAPCAASHAVSIVLSPCVRFCTTLCRISEGGRRNAITPLIDFSTDSFVPLLSSAPR